jgi:signal transduction histidine kinase
VNRGLIRFFLLTASILAIDAHAQLTQNGRADLSAYNIETDAPFDLSGRWEFYWNELLTPADFTSGRQPQYIDVPGSWHRQGDFRVLGYGTYRLRIRLPKDRSGLALYFPIINSAAKIWINGELVHETGVVADDPKKYEAELNATIVSIPEHIPEAELVMQVANYVYFSGGIGAEPKLDRSASLFARINRYNGIENIFAGSLIALFIYQLILFFLYQRAQSYLWLALICLGVALRAVITHRGSFLLPNLFPEVSWELWKRIEFGSIYAITMLFPLYVYDLFPQQAPRKPIVIFVSVSLILCLLVLVTPQYIFGSVLEVCHISLLCGFFYAVYSIGKAWRQGNTDARIILLGVLVSFPFILGEILKNSVLVSFNVGFTYLVEMGMLVFLLFQVYLLAHHYSKSYKNLELLNQNLEKMVEERTGELRTANTVKDRLLSVMSHDIKSPLNSLRGILQIYNKGAISRDEFSTYAKHIENDLSKTTILVENILYWTASQLKGIQLKMERFDLHQLMEENVQLFQTIASGKKISLQHNTPSNLVISSDRNILNLVLRNLISNAIKFSYEGGVIDIFMWQTKESLFIRVKDDGIGMDRATLESLQSPAFTVSASGTENEEGTGLGLAICREYLQKAGGQLTIESTEGKGSTFTIILPGD